MASLGQPRAQARRSVRLASKRRLAISLLLCGHNGRLASKAGAFELEGRRYCIEVGGVLLSLCSKTVPLCASPVERQWSRLAGAGAALALLDWPPFRPTRAARPPSSSSERQSIARFSHLAASSERRPKWTSSKVELLVSCASETHAQQRVAAQPACVAAFLCDKCKLDHCERREASKGEKKRALFQEQRGRRRSSPTAAELAATL